jgi:hypothetical protein
MIIGLVVADPMSIISGGSVGSSPGGLLVAGAVKKICTTCRRGQGKGNKRSDDDIAIGEGGSTPFYQQKVCLFHFQRHKAGSLLSCSITTTHTH